MDANGYLPIGPSNTVLFSATNIGTFARKMLKMAEKMAEKQMPVDMCRGANFMLV